MNLYSYIIRWDYGFAPNPFFGWCTLATCKPDIRKAAINGDWIIGLAGRNYPDAGNLVLAMQVEEILTFNEYWIDERFMQKKPVINGSMIQIFGDNIYHCDASGWHQADSHHSQENGVTNPGNLERDTDKTAKVLLSQKFVYYGSKSIRIPDELAVDPDTGNKLRAQRKHNCHYSDSFINDIVKWLTDTNIWGLQAFPHEFQRIKQTS